MPGIDDEQKKKFVISPKDLLGFGGLVFTCSCLLPMLFLLLIFVGFLVWGSVNKLLIGN